MGDFAVSDDPRVQAQLDRLDALSVPQGRLGLDTIRALLKRLGNPQRRLPPVFHVAGTNGKGSTCAFLRAALEAAGHRVHVFTSPHLVRFNERMRVAGTLISDATPRMPPATTGKCLTGPTLSSPADPAPGILSTKNIIFEKI